MKEITTQQKNAITIVRVLSMMMIITCHILQGYNQPLAFLFNVGVQIFFLLSGFLYGKIEITSISSFVKKCSVKVYIPFIILVLLCVAIYKIFNVIDVPIRDVVPYVFNMQGFIGTPIEGLNHLWFLSVLMVCYCITPIAQKILRYNFIWYLALWIITCVIEFGFVQKMQSIAAWVMLYLLGMFWGKNENKWINIGLPVTSTIISFVMMCFLKMEYLTDPHMVRYSIGLHCVLALCIVSVLYCALGKIEFCMPKWLQYCNDVSYEVYLIHHILILGPLSLLFLTPIKAINIVLIIVITFVLSFLLNRLTSLIKEII